MNVLLKHFEALLELFKELKDRNYFEFRPGSVYFKLN
jgi:hypothetical protein